MLNRRNGAEHGSILIHRASPLESGAWIVRTLHRTHIAAQTCTARQSASKQYTARDNVAIHFSSYICYWHGVPYAAIGCTTPPTGAHGGYACTLRRTQSEIPIMLTMGKLLNSARYVDAGFARHAVASATKVSKDSSQCSSSCYGGNRVRQSSC